MPPNRTSSAAGHGFLWPVGWSEGLGACDIDRSDRFDADDGPLGFATRHFLEAGPGVHGLCPEPHVFVVGTSRFVDRVSLNQRGALFLGVGNGSLEERLCHTLAAVLGRYNKADD
jgi:hypothetical protein